MKHIRTVDFDGVEAVQGDWLLIQSIKPGGLMSSY